MTARNSAVRRRFYHGIGFRLLLVGSTLLAIPWAAYRYVQETEDFLRSAQGDRLLGIAEAISTVLHDRADLFAPLGELAADLPEERVVYLHTLRNPIQLDGYSDDWSELLPLARTHRQGAGNPDAYRSLAGVREGYVFVLLLVQDDSVVYPHQTASGLRGGDRVLLRLEGGDGNIANYRISTPSPGWAGAFRASETSQSAPARREPRIHAEWQETTSGYTVEIRIPESFVGNRIGFDIEDNDGPGVNDAAPRHIAAPLDFLVAPSPAIERVVQRLARGDVRITVVDKNRQILAREGSLATTADPGVEAQDDHAGLLKILYRLILPAPEALQTEPESGVRVRGEEVSSALRGRAQILRRAVSESQSVIVSAATPILSATGILGAVLVEQTTHGILLLKNQALERLFNLSLPLLALTSLVLLAFASRLTSRIRRLSSRIESAATVDGRIRHLLPEGPSRDEIGDLNRSFATLLKRLDAYQRYLETMTSRLAHELRTPLTVVQTSLENLEYERDSEALRRYLGRAREGASRLGLIMTRMREASRLEQSLQVTEHAKVDLCSVVGAAVEGYRIAFPRERFTLILPECPAWITGAPELIIQALDKLIANAVDFRTVGSAILVRLARRTGGLDLCVENTGQLLPSAMREALFDSMVSLRTDHGDEPHLGLGLYLVRLIAEHHGGSVMASNLPSGGGVAVTITFPAGPSPAPKAREVDADQDMVRAEQG